MKKVKHFTLIFFVLSLIICCFACKNDSPIVLSTPCTLDCVINEGVSENQILLVTDFNPNASAYEFFISDSEDVEKIYVSYISSTNTLDVTNIFVDKKNYSYFVRYIGNNKKFLNSLNSQTKVFTPESDQVKSPTIELKNTSINWFKITYATGYEVYETILDVNDNAITQTIKIAELNSNTYTYNFNERINDVNAPYCKFQYEVKALSSGFYASSNNSNKVVFVKDITLQTPNNLTVNKSNDTFTLTWSTVQYATEYEIVCNENTTVTSQTNSLDVTSLITNYAKYTFKVKAIASDAIGYEQSNYSSNYEYNHTITLTAPQNLSAQINGEYLIVNFDAVELAQIYTLQIICNGNIVYENANLSTTSETLTIENLNLPSNSIIIKVKANQNGFYINESEFTQISFNIS